MCLRVCYGQIFVLAIALLSFFLFGELWHPNAHNSKKNQSQLLLAHFEGNLSVLCKTLIINVLWSFCDNFISSSILINVLLCPKDTYSCQAKMRMISTQGYVFLCAKDTCYNNRCCRSVYTKGWFYVKFINISFLFQQFKMSINVHKFCLCEGCK